MQNSFVIKVSDLLNTPGATDEIHFENIISSKVPWLIEPGISGEVFLQALNEDDILVELKNISAEIEDISDITWNSFVREVIWNNYSAKFVRNFSDEQDETREIFDEEFPINEKSETIDLEDMIVQSILLQEPITKYAPWEENTYWDDDDMYESYDSERESKLGWKVTFS